VGAAAGKVSGMRRILVADDDTGALGYIANTLRDKYEVIAVTCGDQALDVLDAGAPLDLLLTDIRMPGLNGIALARMAVMRRRALPIVYMSAFTDPALENVGTLLGPILTKPFAAAVLLETVERAIAQGKRGEAARRA
jgi:CheY-like chemotaxis protein